MNELLSWGVVVGAVLGLIALGFAALQVVSTGDEFWIAKSFFVIAGVIAAGRMILWGITTPRGFTLRLAVCFVTCGLVAAFVVEAVRYVNRKRGHWAGSNPAAAEAPRVRESDADDEEQEPTLVCVRTRVADLGYVNEVLTEKTSHKNVRAPIVAFANKGDKASMENYVKARITFYDSEDGHFQHVNNGVWLDEEGTSIQYFDVGEVRELAVAVMPAQGMAYAFDGEVMLDIAPAGKELRVEVTLVGGLLPATLGTFNFRLTLEPEVSIEEIKGA